MTTPQLTTNVTIDIPPEIVKDAKQELSESSDNASIEDYILKRLQLTLDYPDVSEFKS